MPAASAQQEEEARSVEVQVVQFEEIDVQTFDEEVRMMDLEMGRKTRTAPEQAGADLAPQSAADTEAPPTASAPNTAPGAFHSSMDIDFCNLYCSIIVCAATA